MTEDVPNYSAHVEARAQRPLWVLLVGIMIGLVAWELWRPSGGIEPIRHRKLVEAAGLFAEGLTEASLSSLGAPELSDTAEAAFLRGVIATYFPQPRSARPEARRWLEEAAEADVPGADTLLGLVLLDEKECDGCAAEAARWFERALRRRGDRDARLGLAVSLIQRDRDVDVSRAHLDALLAEDVQDTIRLWALTLRAAAEPGPHTASAYTEEAARAGFAFAQFRLATKYASGVTPESRLWLAMAALQGNEHALERLGAEADPSLMRVAEERLLAIAADPSTQLGKAAQWCIGRTDENSFGDKICRVRALEGHIVCSLPAAVIAALGIGRFEEATAYSRCRTEFMELK